ETGLVVKAAGGTFSLPLMPVEDYPQLPALPSEVGEVDAGEWATATKRASIAVAKDDSIPGFTGVMLEFGAGLAVVSTDRYRLSASEIGWQATLDGRELHPLLVPASAMAMATMATNGTVGIHLDTEDQNVIGFSSGLRQLVTRLLDGTPIKWRRLCPEKFAAEVIVQSSVLDAVLRRASTFIGNETTKEPAAIVLS